MTDHIPAPASSPRPRRRRAWLMATVALLLIASLITGIYLHWVYVQHRFAAVTPGQVYKSGAMHPSDLPEMVKQYGIRSVIDLRTTSVGEDPHATPEAELLAERDALTAVGAKHFHLPTGQVPEDAVVDRFLQIASDPANRPMLIHCYHGTGRTELFVALYRIEFEGWSNDAARRATRMIVAGSSFDASKGKGRYLMDYRPRRQAPPKP